MNKKQVIRITESELRGMIMECLKQKKNSINEDSFNERPDFCGIEGVKFIEHGEWADPELKYGKYYIDYYDIEDAIIDIMREDGADYNNDDLFVKYCQDNSELIKNYIEEYGKEEEEEDFIYEERKGSDKRYRIYPKAATHFAVNKKTGLIVNSWEYGDVESNVLKQYKKDYFFDDLNDYGFDPKEYSILTKKGLMQKGINPDVITSWSNNGQTPCK